MVLTQKQLDMIFAKYLNDNIVDNLKEVDANGMFYHYSFDFHLPFTTSEWQSIQDSGYEFATISIMVQHTVTKSNKIYQEDQGKHIYYSSENTSEDDTSYLYKMTGEHLRTKIISTQLNNSSHRQLLNYDNANEYPWRLTNYIFVDNCAFSSGDGNRSSCPKPYKKTITPTTNNSVMRLKDLTNNLFSVDKLLVSPHNNYYYTAFNDHDDGFLSCIFVVAFHSEESNKVYEIVSKHYYINHDAELLTIKPSY